MLRLASLASFAAVLLAAPAAPSVAPAQATRPDTLVLYVAASLTKPLQPVLDDFAARTHIVIQRESGASLEHVRKITELHRIPDLLLLADADVFPQLLIPKYATWYAEFARNRMVVAFTRRSKYADQITPANWTTILRRPDVDVGRTDPDLAPVGYRTLLMFQLAARYYHAPQLGAELLANAPPRNMRENAAELAALLSAGELDYIYDYQSVAESDGFRYLTLPSEIDLGDPSRAAEYSSASVPVKSPERGAPITVHGAPIVYGLGVPLGAPHPAAARAFLAYLITPAVLTRLRAAGVDMLDHPIVSGRGAPAELRGTSGR